MYPDGFVSVQTAAEVLGLTVRTLYTYKSTGRGPTVIVQTIEGRRRLLYSVAGIREFRAGQTARKKRAAARKAAKTKH